jgi:hypothetical protein
MDIADREKRIPVPSKQIAAYTSCYSHEHYMPGLLSVLDYEY